MKVNIKEFRVPPGKKVRLESWPTRVTPFYASKKEARELLHKQVRELDSLQRVHYADDRYAMLVIFQAMDAAGKDSAIRHVMSGINPQGCEVHSFKHPSAEELDHDFLWRTTRALPERGRIGIFNRSYYEEVLVVRVHPKILEAQRIPDGLVNEETIWQQRFRSIAGMEKHLHENGTRIVKFFLHLSKDEQRTRFIKRIEDPDKNWKFSVADVREREFWDDYMHAYEECLSATSTREAPWYIVPADDKANAHLIIAHVLVGMFKSLKLRYPKPTREHREELKAIRINLEK